jgi:hypothetical protein
MLESDTEVLRSVELRAVCSEATDCCRDENVELRFEAADCWF